MGSVTCPHIYSRLEKDAVALRLRPGCGGFFNGAQEVRADLAVLEVACGDRKADGVAALSGALRGPNDVATPPFRGAEALTEGEIAGLMKPAGGQLVEAVGGAGELELEFGQDLERARGHAPAGRGEDGGLEADRGHLAGGTLEPQAGLVCLQVRELGAAALDGLVEAVEDERASGLGVVAQPMLHAVILGQVPIAIDVWGDEERDGNIVAVELRDEMFRVLPGVVENTRNRNQENAVHVAYYRTHGATPRGERLGG